jgi:hypothetical protein
VRVLVVRERGVGAAKDVITEDYSVPDVDSTLQGNTIANNCSAFDERVSIEIAVSAHLGTSQDHRILPHPCPGPDRRTVEDMRKRMDHGLRVDHSSYSFSAGERSDLG